MKIALYNNWSQANKSLHDLIGPNHQKYADRHGYTNISEEIAWPESNLVGLKKIHSLLGEFDAVLSHGSDVLFMNHRLKVERLVSTYGLTMARECIELSPLNNDVAIWVGDDGRFILDALIESHDTWKSYRYLWQRYIWNLMQTDPHIDARIRLVAPRVMNSTPHPGESFWQPGDWIFHASCGDLGSKIHYVKSWMKFAGEPLWPENCL